MIVDIEKIAEDEKTVCYKSVCGDQPTNLFLVTKADLTLFIHRKLWKIGLTDSAVQRRPGLRQPNSKTLGYALGGWSSRAQAAPGRVLYGGEAERRAAINSSIAACGR